jgi:hypothetical protein
MSRCALEDAGAGVSATALGWAVCDADGTLNMRTVSDTQRAAKVNWLFASENMFVSRGMTDERIERMWEDLSAKTGAKVVRVNITAMDAAHG